MRKVHLTLSCLLVLFLCSCVAGLPSTGSSVLLFEQKEGFSSNNGHKEMKRGEACTQNILGVASFGDASMQRAMRDGRIQEVSRASRDFFAFNLYYLKYAKVCTVVYGE
ncbi:TRL domain-containing protein [Pseudomonadota bacterium]